MRVLTTLIRTLFVRQMGWDYVFFEDDHSGATVVKTRVAVNLTTSRTSAHAHTQNAYVFVYVRAYALHVHKHIWFVLICFGLLDGFVQGLAEPCAQ